MTPGSMKFPSPSNQIPHNTVQKERTTGKKRSRQEFVAAQNPVLEAEDVIQLQYKFSKKLKLDAVTVHTDLDTLSVILSAQDDAAAGKEAIAFMAERMLARNKYEQNMATYVLNSKQSDTDFIVSDEDGDTVRGTNMVQQKIRRTKE